MIYTSGSPGIRYYEQGFLKRADDHRTDSTTPLYVQNPPSFRTMQPPYATDPLGLP
ncbi:MAG: hypothetical protein IPM96_18950 [Ignavibacteria bacterium]|nr:hypothetical protein [Ignavibacteria bacterium]